MPSLLSPIRIIPVLAFASLSGCSLYYETKAEDLVERQISAMVFVEGGEFMMGNPGGWSVRHDTIPTHRVVLDDFYIQKYEVTQGDFELFMAVTGYESSNELYQKKRNENSKRYQSDFPAVATWSDASAFCTWLGEQSGKNVSLPTEAEWEYAARTRGKMHRYATGNGEAIEGVTMAARIGRSRYDDLPYKHSLPRPPGTFPPNPLGLYDMSGNVAEWVHDYYRADYYVSSPPNNPKGPEAPVLEEWFNEPYRVVRGGDFTDFIGNTTVTRRKAIESVANNTIGFRCSRSSGS
ncbi:SUMF1/EgtB/PvdO family nonheme iron enzyme [Marinobacter sp.]|uniref:formylglycine-generating enzyme family protein n=1 Tax=Marinobacter sp. TaxID=50741 RepID=UPI001B7C6725|nr:SUMF1/EgtB/PvdO family nonheme iron enzyme [Marinobacter sp.]MBQ0832385.1 SUMF1/EgtB/PvdO family nonheme iron enzyme [Marinobacter sp.]